MLGVRPVAILKGLLHLVNIYIIYIYILLPLLRGGYHCCVRSFIHATTKTDCHPIHIMEFNLTFKCQDIQRDFLRPQNVNT